MSLTIEQKERKKELAKYKRKVLELAGMIHDIVEDTLWDEYVKLPQLSNDIQFAMQELNSFKAQHDFLQ